MISAATHSKRLAIVTALALWLARGAAIAAPSCTINNLTSVSFGRYDSLAAAPLDSLGTIVVHCTGASASVTYSLTAGSSGAFIPRTLTGPATHKLDFNLYLDSAHTVVWGDGTSGTSLYGPISVAQDTDNTAFIYGRMPPGQAVPAGVYVETLTLLITF